MKFGIAVPNTGEYADLGLLVKLAQEAEATGWDGFFIWDTLYSMDEPAVDAIVALSAISAKTEKIRVGTMALGLGRRRPWKVAREAATLDLLSHGRLILAVGAGHPSERPFQWKGEPQKLVERLARLDESLAILEGLWSETSFSYQGKYFSVSEATFLPRPVQARIPIWVVTTRDLENIGPLRRAARYDGIVGGTSPKDLAQMLGIIQGYRNLDTPFDAVIRYDLAEPTPNSSEAIKIWEAAGATWCRCELGVSFKTLKEAQEFLRAGPPPYHFQRKN
jgi:alkanesulfonate monooxygenase SsuD/methylene tetrahydromethanopterin reductase-like flavin-dependent oxidoreductase (luciferase family)